MWLLIVVNSALSKLRQEDDHECGASLVYRMRFYLKDIKKEKGII